MNILFLGDIIGRPGRRMVARRLASLCRSRSVDVVVANAENSAGGLGATPETLAELTRAGVHAFTMGNHTWRKRSLSPLLDEMTEIVRPANYPPGVPGRGATVVRLPDGRKLGLINLIGRVYMEAFDCPFRAVDNALGFLHPETPIVLVDMHAEATSEKVAMGWYLDGRCSAVVGTHTHVQTGDEWIMPQGTAYITDVGMCGPYHSVIGSDLGNVLTKFRTGIPNQFEVAGGPCMINAVLIEVDDATGRSRRIERIFERE